MDKLVRGCPPVYQQRKTPLVSNLASDALRPDCCPERVPPFLHVVAPVRLGHTSRSNSVVRVRSPATGPAQMSISSTPSLPRITASARRLESLQPAAIGESVRIA